MTTCTPTVLLASVAQRRVDGRVTRVDGGEDAVGGDGRGGRVGAAPRDLVGHVAVVARVVPGGGMERQGVAAQHRDRVPAVTGWDRPVGLRRRAAADARRWGRVEDARRGDARATRLAAGVGDHAAVRVDGELHDTGLCDDLNFRGGAGDAVERCGQRRGARLTRREHPGGYVAERRRIDVPEHQVGDVFIGSVGKFADGAEPDAAPDLDHLHAPGNRRENVGGGVTGVRRQWAAGVGDALPAGRVLDVDAA